MLQDMYPRDDRCCDFVSVLRASERLKQVVICCSLGSLGPRWLCAGEESCCPRGTPNPHLPTGVFPSHRMAVPCVCVVCVCVCVCVCVLRCAACAEEFIKRAEE